MGAAGVNAAPGVHPAIAPLIVHLASEWERITGDLLVDGWCWGWGIRRIRGSTGTWSNHSWGLAVDLNAPRWPLGSTARPPNAAAFKTVADRLMFRWGAYYDGRRDPMHLEFMGTPADARRLVAQLTPPVQEDQMLTHGDAGAAVRTIQQALLDRDRTALPRFGADADYGDETETAVEAFQAAHDLQPTGTVDGLTAALLLDAARGEVVLETTELDVITTVDHDQLVDAVHDALAGASLTLTRKA
jgi:hypothetical protein